MGNFQTTPAAVPVPAPVQTPVQEASQSRGNAYYPGGTLRLLQSFGLPITAPLKGACCAFKLRQADPEFLRILKYLECSQDPSFGIKILLILRVTPRAHYPPVDFKDVPKAKGKRRMMLWQGIRADNLQTLLENGPQLPEEGNSLNNYGISFNDRAGASCYLTDYGGKEEDREGKEGYLVLSEVLVGESYSGWKRCNVRAPPSKEVMTGGLWGETKVVPCQSVLTRGKYVPDPSDTVTKEDCMWPLGGTVEVEDKDADTVYNQYTVFDAEQIRVKYIVKVEFTEEPYYH